MMTNAIVLLRTYTRALIWICAILLIVVGFAVDGTSEAGHHAAFILGGVAVGLGLARKVH